LVILVSPGQKKPYFIKAEGIPKGVYYRVGAHNKRANEDLMEDLMLESERKYWDEEITNVNIEELDHHSMESFYGKGWSENILLADGILNHSSHGEKKVTRAGIIYFHPKPSQFYHQAEVLYTEFEDSTMTQAIKTVDFTGPLPQLVLQVTQQLKRHLVKKEEIQGVQRKDIDWQIPEIVIRESLLNALLHRKYSIPGAIKVAVFQDRIEIFSPGNFPGPIDLEQLGNGTSYTRNPKLRQLARKDGLVEKRGMGFRIILGECQKNGNPKPKVEEGGDYIKVTLYRNQEDTHSQALPELYSALQRHKDKMEPVQPKQIAEVLNVSINTARSRLVDLVDKGYMFRSGAGRGVKYHWK
jgi:ATP-dependent DNA helicase RecG